MGDFKDNMSEEKRPPTLLPEGHRLVRINEMIASTSKKGNRMFVTTVEDVKTKKAQQTWLVAEPKKRWILKSLLTAVGIKGGEDGVYDYSVTDVIGKTAIAVIEHAEEEYIDREGETKKTMKSKITEFYEAPKDASGQDLAWEE